MKRKITNCKPNSITNNSFNSNSLLKTNSRFLGVFLFSMLLGMFLLAGQQTSAQTLTSDKADYRPGMTVLLTGTGFQPGETVMVQVLHNPTCCDDGTSPYHLPWYVTADANGDISTTWWVDYTEIGAALVATATGQSSGAVAQCYFTDSGTSSSTVFGNFQCDADLYQNRFQFPSVDSLNCAKGDTMSSDDWFGNKPIYIPGTNHIINIPVTGKGIGVIDTTGAAAFKAAVACTNPLASRNLTKTFGRNFKPLDDYIVLDPNSINYGDTVILFDAFASRDQFGLSGSLDNTTFTGQSNKNGQDPTTWTLGPGTSGPNKNDLVDVGVSLRLVQNAPKYHPSVYQPSPKLIATGIATTLSTTGDSHIDAEIFKEPTVYDPNCSCLIHTGPDFGHSTWAFRRTKTSPDSIVKITQGDFIVSADYTNGGTAADVSVRIWVNTDSIAKMLGFALTKDYTAKNQWPLLAAAWNAFNGKPFRFADSIGTSVAPFGYALIGPKDLEQNNALASARINTRINTCETEAENTPGAPWGSIVNAGADCNDDIQKLQLLEATIAEGNLGITIFDLASTEAGGAPSCTQNFGSLLYKTRSSASFTAELKDFAGPFLIQQVQQASIAAKGDTIGCNETFATICDTTQATGPLKVWVYGPAASANGPFTNLFDFYTTDGSFNVKCYDTVTVAGYYFFTDSVATGCGSSTVVRVVNNSDPVPPTLTCPPTVNINCGTAVPACYADGAAGIKAFVAAGGVAFDAVGLDSASFRCSQGSLVGNGVCGTVTKTYTVSDKCGNPASCTQTININAIPLSVTCNDDTTVASCTGQSQINTLFAKWLAGFTSSGGCNRTSGFTGTPAAPAACGGSTSVTYTVTSDCEASQVCTKTFTVTAAPAVSVTCNDDTTVASCTGQAQVNALFAKWLAGFTSTGGCNRSAGFTGTPVAPAACGGSTNVTYTVTSDCESAKVCTKTFTVTAAPAVSVTCNDDTTLASCTGQAQVNSLFTKWLAGFSYSGGCNTSGSFNGTPVAPSACGGSTNVTYTVTSDCESAKVCTKTFTVTAAPAVSVTCNDDTTVASCTGQAQVNALFAKWLAGFSHTGGCNTDGSFGTTPVAPSACGGSTNVTYTVTSDCESPKVCTKTFTVTAAPAVSVTCNDDTTVASCTGQAQVNSLFAKWLAGFTSSGGCNRQAGFDGTPAAPAACGGSTTVVYTVTSDCESAKVCTKTFTVTAAPAVSVTCNDDTTVASCTGQADVNNLFAKWLAGFTSSGGCNRSASFNGTPVAPSSCGGSTNVTYTVTSDCESPKVCTKTFTVTAAPATVITCNDDTTVASCTGQAQVNTLFGKWLEGFSVSGGCNASGSFNGTPVAPAACGGATNVTYTVTDDCGQPKSCTKTFTVTAAPAVSVTCNDDTTVASCTGQAQVNSLFAKWLAGFTSSGGCNRSASFTGTPVAPAACGGSTNVTYTVTSDCESAKVCTKTFTVTAAPAVSVTCNDDTTVASCTGQAQINSLFAKWLAGFSFSGGCNTDGSFNGTPVAPAACGGSTNVTYTVTSDCESPKVCTKTFTVTAAPAVSVTCNDDTTVASCTGQAQVNSLFAKWLAGFSFSGGCNTDGSFNGTPVAPAACGGSTNVTYTVTSDCESPKVCTKTFTVTAAPAVSVTCNDDTTASSCLGQSAINSLFAKWLAGFSHSGGCNTEGSFGTTPVAPSACGGSTNVTYTVTSDCESAKVCTKTFSVTAAPAVSVTCNDDTTSSSCQTQGQINAQFAKWLAGFSHSGGCNTEGSFGTTPVAPAACGGSTSVTYTVTSDCESAKVCTKTFTVTAAPAVSVTCNDDTTVASCTGQAQVNSLFAKWLAGFSYSGGCNASGSFNGTPVAPAACGGSTNVTYTVTSDCESAKVCTKTFTVTAAPAVSVTCNDDTTVASCTGQAEVDNLFAKWLAGFSSSGGCNRSASFNGTPVAPAACGGSTNVTYTVTSDCESAKVCTKTFTVTAAPAVSVTCNDDTTVASCTGQAEVNNLFAKWLAGFTSSGGCNRSASFNGTPVAPAACGGSTNVTYTVTSDCESAKVCTKTFTVSAAPAVSVTCNDDTTVASCTGQAQVNALFAKWLAGFTSSGGCNRQAGFGTTPVAPAACGGSTNVTYTVTSDCESAKVCTKTFTVSAAPAVVLTCNQDTTVSGLTQSEVNAKFAAWVAGFSATGGCDLNITPISASAPDKCGGAVTVKYKVTSACEDADSCVATFTVAPSDLSCSFDKDSAVCGSTGNDRFVKVSGGTGPYSYKWTVTGAGYVITSADNVNPVIYTAGSSEAGVFTVVITDAIGCTTSCTVKDTCYNALQGCTPGFWKNHISIWKDASSDIPKCIAAAITALGPPYSGNGTTGSSFASTFGVTAAQMQAVGLNPSLTLIQALNLGGGGFFKLARHGVSALLGGCSIQFTYTSSQVLVMLHNAIVSQQAEPTASMFAAANEVKPDICPAAGKATKRLTDDILTGEDNVGIAAYPNPFSSIVNIEFVLNNSSSKTVVEIYNVTGEKVATLFEGYAEPKVVYNVKFNGDAFAEGIYFTRITTDNGYNFEKMVLIK